MPGSLATVVRIRWACSHLHVGLLRPLRAFRERRADRERGALLFGFLSAIGATLTLPGIAGIVLTIGMAVDANVLIFERIREELEKCSKSPEPGHRAGL